MNPFRYHNRNESIDQARTLQCPPLQPRPVPCSSNVCYVVETSRSFLSIAINLTLWSLSCRKQCQFCPRGVYQDEEQQLTCKLCPPDHTTAAQGVCLANFRQRIKHYFHTWITKLKRLGNGTVPMLLHQPVYHRWGQLLVARHVHWPARWQRHTRFPVQMQAGISRKWNSLLWWGWLHGSTFKFKEDEASRIVL